MAGKTRKYGNFDFYQTLDIRSAEACRLGRLVTYTTSDTSAKGVQVNETYADANTYADAGIISCEVNLTLLGQYQFRVIKQAKPNCIAKADNAGKDAEGQNGNQDNQAK